MAKRREKPQNKNHYSAFAQVPSASTCGLLQLWSHPSFQMKMQRIVVSSVQGKFYKTGALPCGKLKLREGYNIGL